MDDLTVNTSRLPEPLVAIELKSDTLPNCTQCGCRVKLTEFVPDEELGVMCLLCAQVLDNEAA